MGGHKNFLTELSFIYFKIIKKKKKTITAAMHIQNCSSKSLLMSLILHFSCQNFEICYLNVTSITSRWLLFSYQIYRVIIMGFFCLFASGHFVLHFHFLFFCLFLFFFFPSTLVFDLFCSHGSRPPPLTAPQHSGADCLVMLWSATSSPRRPTTVWALPASLICLSACLEFAY